eukprot:TRINITY_DN122062_c0_g1_i1.p1 TRINITY_DN122062_c0_g1~~TRINITY_DN122062_c0_g1_i1.p1  ORF type:complete len:579 (+),score=118.52 TRINITY_DN122062_c0_g1_i1:62-1798(+)
MAGLDGDAERREPLRDSLFNDEAPVPRSFYKEELKYMCGVGWPMLISFFCRYGMASEDLAFVGHIGHEAPALLTQVFSRRSLLTHAASHLMAYAAILTSADGHHYGPDEYLAAAGLSDMITNIMIIPPLAFNMSLNALVSQAMGSGNKKMAGTWLQLSLVFVTLSYLPMLISFFYVEPLLKLFGFQAEICELAGTYAKWNAFWPIPNAWYQCMRFYFQAQGITRPAMINNIFFLAMNAMLNWIFVFGGPFRGMGWQGFGFIGAAISLSCSRTAQPLVYWLYMFVWRKAHVDTWPQLAERTFAQSQHVKSFLAMSLPQIGTLIFQAIVGQATTLLIAKLGKTAVAASSAAQGATIVLSGGLSPTLRMLSGMRVGFYLGKGQPKRAQRVAYLSLALGGVVTGIISVVVLPFGQQVIAVVTNDEMVQEPAASILPAIMLNLVATIIVSVGTGGILTSQGRTKIVTFLSMGFELPLSVGSTALLVLYFNADLQTVYWAQGLVSLFEALVVVAILQRSDWPRFAKEAQERQAAPAATTPPAGSSSREEDSEDPARDPDRDAKMLSLQPIAGSPEDAPEASQGG